MRKQKNWVPWGGGGTPRAPPGSANVNGIQQIKSLMEQSLTNLLIYSQSPENLNIVGFFDLHSSDPEDSLQCGSMDPNGGIQNALGFMYAINEVNKNMDLNLSPGIKLGKCEKSLGFS